MAAEPVIPVRRLRFEYPDHTDPTWTPHRPEFACAANSVSLLMPYMEPYFVRAVGRALPRLDGNLAATTRNYLAQETQHHRQHQQFNDILVAAHPKLRWLESLAARTYRWLGRTRSLEFNLAFAAGSETFAYAAARWAADRRFELFHDADPGVASLFLWHLAEEVEHKSVAHDVYQAVDGSRLRRLAAVTVAIALIMFFVGMGTLTLLFDNRRLFHPIAWLRLISWSITFVFELLPSLVLSLLANHHPTQFVDPLWYEVWLRELERDPSGAHTLPVWYAID